MSDTSATRRVNSEVALASEVEPGLPSSLDAVVALQESELHVILNGSLSLYER